MGVEVKQQRAIMVCRVPESVGYVPVLEEADGLYGISTARRAVCIYMRTEGTVPGARIDEFAGEAQEIAELLGA